MTDVMPGGRRRIDRVLAPDYLDALAELPLARLRAKRREAEQEEVDLAHTWRLLHARIEAIHAEQARRAQPREEPQADIDGVESVPAGDPDAKPSLGAKAEKALRVLTRERRNAVRYLALTLGRGRHILGEPSRPQWTRRRVERLLADVDLADVGSRTDDELARVLRTFETEEGNVGDVRSRVQRVVDECTAELARRYAAAERSKGDAGERPAADTADRPDEAADPDAEDEHVAREIAEPDPAPRETPDEGRRPRRRLAGSGPPADEPGSAE